MKHFALLEILPALTFSQRYHRENGELTRIDQSGELSLTAKYGVSANLILDGTINPDFSQVESDASQVDINLRYSLFYTEKRPFFLEGRDNFAVAATAMSPYENLDPVISILHTRTIAAPALGVKLSGKLGNPSTIASLYAIDDVLEELRDQLGRYAHRKEYTTDFLASFMYIPGTVVFLGYGSIFEKIQTGEDPLHDDGRYLEMQRGLFFKTSYLWRN